MEREASVQHCKQSTGRHLLFSPGFLQNVLQVQEDLCNAGIVPLWTALHRISDIFVFNRVRSREVCPASLRSHLTPCCSCPGLGALWPWRPASSPPAI